MIKYMMIGGITIDDTVIQYGRVKFNAAGGNGIYSALGARLWADGIGIVSCIGHNYPEDYLRLLENSGVDTSGIRIVDTPSQHLWLLYEQDGTKQFVFQNCSGKLGSAIDPAPEQIPDDYLHAEMAHLSAMGFAAQHELAKFLRKNAIAYSYDITQAGLGINTNEYFGNFATTNSRLLLPSIEEIELIYGKQPLLPLLARIAQTGPRIFAVKMGSQGSIVYDADLNLAFRIPIFPVDVIDPTGAGDAYCGGFLAGFNETRNVQEAGICGAVSASFAIEDFGALHLLRVNKKKARERADQIRKNVEVIHSSAFQH